METNEVVSIIIPIYNVEAYLRQCLETVIHQTYPHIWKLSWSMMVRQTSQKRSVKIF